MFSSWEIAFVRCSFLLFFPQKRGDAVLFLVERRDFFFDRKKKSLKFVYKIRRGRALTNGWKWGKIKWKITAVQLLKMFFYSTRNKACLKARAKKEKKRKQKNARIFVSFFSGNRAKGALPNPCVFFVLQTSRWKPYLFARKQGRSWNRKASFSVSFVARNQGKQKKTHCCFCRKQKHLAFANGRCVSMVYGKMHHPEQGTARVLLQPTARRDRRPFGQSEQKQHHKRGTDGMQQAGRRPKCNTVSKRHCQAMVVFFYSNGFCGAFR